MRFGVGTASRNRGISAKPTHQAPWMRRSLPRSARGRRPFIILILIILIVTHVRTGRDARIETSTRTKRCQEPSVPVTYAISGVYRVAGVGGRIGPEA
jgi:hypothetical protein